jgi:hypothetical protein
MSYGKTKRTDDIPHTDAVQPQRVGRGVKKQQNAPKVISSAHLVFPFFIIGM